MRDLIDRKDLGAAIDNWLAIDRYYHPYSKQKTIPVSELVDIIKLLPSAQPEYRMDEWCTDCKEYDNERHCCPRFNRVIRTTLREVREEQPEIVRCKDCMHWCNHKRLNIPWCRELHIDMGAEDFCSMAKRRE